MNVITYDQYSELVEAISYHTGKLEAAYKSLSAFEQVHASDLTQEEAYSFVENLIEDTKKLGINFKVISKKPGYAELQVDLESLKGEENLYRVIYTK